MQRTQVRPTDHCSFSGMRLAKCSLTIHLNKSIQYRVQFLDLLKMGLDQINRRDFLASDLLGHLNGRKKSEIVHAVARRTEMASLACVIVTDLAQGDHDHWEASCTRRDFAGRVTREKIRVFASPFASHCFRCFLEAAVMRE